MAKDAAISKRAKISQAQEYVLLSVFGAAVFLGVAISLVSHFVKKISFNAGVIAEEETAIVNYSNAIRDIGICRKPSGSVYTDDELRRCVPESIEASSISGTLRANILEKLAANKALNSVPKESTSGCVNAKTNKNYTYEELNELYTKASSSEELVAASNLIQSCSALRVIPDALPAYRNEEALLSSLNKIFIISGWEPESISPTGSSGKAAFGTNLQELSVQLSVESGTDTTVKVLNNIEHSIREFNIERATIEWASDNTLNLNAQARAYYMNPSTITEQSKTIKSGDAKK